MVKNPSSKIKTESIDEVILRLLGLKPGVEIDYQTYHDILKKKLAIARLAGKEIPREEDELLREEFKRVRKEKDKGIRFKVKKARVKKKSKSVPLNQNQKQLPGTGGAIVVPKKQSITPKDLIPVEVEDIIEEKKKDNFSSIKKTLESILKTLSSKFKFDQKQSDQDRKEKETERRSKRESGLEGLKKGIGGLVSLTKKIMSPFQGILDKIWRFIFFTLLGRAFTKFMDWMSNGENRKKFDSLVDFLIDHWPALAGAYILFGTGFGKLVRGLLKGTTRMIVALAMNIPKIFGFIKKNKKLALLGAGAAALASGYLSREVGNIFGDKENPEADLIPKQNPELDDAKKTIDQSKNTQIPQFNLGGVVPNINQNIQTFNLGGLVSNQSNNITQEQKVKGFNLGGLVSKFNLGGLIPAFRMGGFNPFGGMDFQTGVPITGAGKDDTLIAAKTGEAILTEKDQQDLSQRYVERSTGEPLSIPQYLAGRKPGYVNANKIGFSGFGGGFSEGGLIQKFATGGIVNQNRLGARDLIRSRTSGLLGRNQANRSLTFSPQQISIDDIPLEQIKFDNPQHYDDYYRRAARRLGESSKYGRFGSPQNPLTENELYKVFKKLGGVPDFAKLSGGKENLTKIEQGLVEADPRLETIRQNINEKLSGVINPQTQNTRVQPFIRNRNAPQRWLKNFTSSKPSSVPQSFTQWGRDASGLTSMLEDLRHDERLARVLGYDIPSLRIQEKKVSVSQQPIDPWGKPTKPNITPVSTKPTLALSPATEPRSLNLPTETKPVPAPQANKPPSPNRYRPGTTVRETGPGMERFPELQRFVNKPGIANIKPNVGIVNKILNNPAVKIGNKAVGPALTGLDFLNRTQNKKQSLQQASIGAGSSLLGGMAGAKVGGAAGAAIGGTIGAAFFGVGAVPGAAIGGAIGAITGGITGSIAASSYADNLTGASALGAQRNRQGKGGGVVGGLNLTQQSFEDAPKTMIMTDPETGRPFVGHKAKRDGKLVYVKSVTPGTGTSNPFEMIGRTLNPSAYVENDVRISRQKHKEALVNSLASLQARGASEETQKKMMMRMGSNLESVQNDLNYRKKRERLIKEGRLKPNGKPYTSQEMMRRKLRRKEGGGYLTPITSNFGIPTSYLNMETGADTQYLPEHNVAVQRGEEFLNYIIPKDAAQKGIGSKIIEIANRLVADADPNSNPAKGGFRNKNVNIPIPKPYDMSRGGITMLPPIDMGSAGSGGMMRGKAGSSKVPSFSNVSPINDRIENGKMYYGLG